MTKRETPPAPLLRKLLMLGVVPAVLMFVVLMVFFTAARLDDARTDLSKNSQLLADSLAPAVEYSVVSGNTDTLEDILRNALRQSKAKWIRVTDVSGDIAGSVNAGDGEISTGDDITVYRSEILQPPVEFGTSGASPARSPCSSSAAASRTRPIGSTRRVRPTCCAESRSARSSPPPMPWTASSG